MSYIKIQKIKKENVEIPENGYIYLGYDDSTVTTEGQGLWMKDDNGNISYILSGTGSNPTVISIDPIGGSYIGNTITINGTNFVQGFTTVTFEGISGTTVNVLSSGQLTVVVPNVQGIVHVVVSTSYGHSGLYEYTINYQSIKPVIVPPILPSQASIGSIISIGGYNFVPGNTITWFNGTSGETNVVSSTFLTAKVPQMASGMTIIYLQAPNGRSNSFSYLVTDALITFTSFDPNYGFIGDTISIYGTNFSIGEIQVRFGSTQAEDITFVTPGHITAKIATGTPFGDTSIRVETISLSGFTVSGSTSGLLPTISSISPSGAIIGDTVTLLGTNFTDTVTVTFSSEIPVIISGSTTSLSIYLSRNIVPGINSVIVTNQYGSSATFSYTIVGSIFGPIISSFNPTSAFRNNPVNLNGSNFKVGSGNSVYYGNVAAFVSAGATSILVKTQISPLSPTGVVDVKIINIAGSYTKSGFIIGSVGSTPIIDKVSPVFAKSGDTIHVYGYYLSDSTISFGTSYPGLSTVTTVINDTHLVTTLPSGLTSSGENKIINVYATGLNGTYKYAPFEAYSPITSYYPDILSFTPISGSIGTLVTISGNSFTKYYTDASIFIAGTFYILDSQSYISNTEVRGYIPNTFGNYGPATIKISTPVGTDQLAVFNITNTTTTTTTIATTTTTTTHVPITTTTTTIGGGTTTTTVGGGTTTTTTTGAETTTTTTEAEITTTTTTGAETTTTTTLEPTTTTTTLTTTEVPPLVYNYIATNYTCPNCITPSSTVDYSSYGIYVDGWYTVNISPESIHLMDAPVIATWVTSGGSGGTFVSLISSGNCDAICGATTTTTITTPAPG